MEFNLKFMFMANETRRAVLSRCKVGALPGESLPPPNQKRETRDQRRLYSLVKGKTIWGYNELIN